jgi:sugar phosphate isomerase/epimerase
MIQKNTLRAIILIISLFSLSFITIISKKNTPINPPLQRNPAWKVGVQLYSFKQQTFTKALEMANASGVSLLEELTDRRMGKEFNDSSFGKMDENGINKLQKMLKEKNLKMSSIYANNPKNMQDWNNYFNIGKKLGIKYFVCEPQKNELNLLDSLSELYGIKIAIHEHAKGKSAYWHPDSVLAVIKGRKNFGACADIGHWVKSGLDPIACLKMLEGHIISVHVKDVSEFGNPTAKNVPLGKGVIDFNGLYKELKRQHFKGIMHIECEFDFDNNLQDIIHSKNYLLGFQPN